jgi:hypothetical protein
MKPAGTPTLFVIHDKQCGRAGVPTQRWTQLSDRFCNRLLIEGVRSKLVERGNAP